MRRVPAEAGQCGVRFLRLRRRVPIRTRRGRAPPRARQATAGERAALHGPGLDTVEERQQEHGAEVGESDDEQGERGAGGQPPALGRQANQEIDDRGGGAAQHEADHETLGLIHEPPREALIRQAVAPLEQEPAVERQRQAAQFVDDHEQRHVDVPRPRSREPACGSHAPDDSARSRSAALAPVSSSSASRTALQANDTMPLVRLSLWYLLALSSFTAARLP